MMLLAFQSGDWAIITVAVIIVGSVLSGMVKFVQAIGILRRGRPVPDEEIRLEQKRENHDYEQND